MKHATEFKRNCMHSETQESTLNFKRFFYDSDEVGQALSDFSASLASPSFVNSFNDVYR
jgi:hypothetical protein